MLKRKLGKEEQPIRTHDPEVNQTQSILLQHLFRKLDLSKVDKTLRGKKLKRAAEVSIKNIGVVNKLLQLIRSVATTTGSGELRVELRLSSTDTQLLSNMREYLPIDLIGSDASPIRYIGYDGPHNFVNHMKYRGEVFNKAIKVSPSALLNYLTRLYNLPNNQKIPTYVDTDISLYVLGTTKDAIPQSLVFSIISTNSKKTQQRPVRFPQTQFGVALSPA